MSESAHDEKAVFLAALQHAVASEREAYLRVACEGDPELLKRVKALLAVHEESQGPLDVRATGIGLELTTDLPAGEGPGTVIGPYKLLEQIGEGGFGLVFMAEQQQPLRRKVAVKIIKPGMDSRQVIARFEAERQALALMDHPNIARVLDAGSTGGGRPYFAMELVRGRPITDYCDEHKLTTRARLELFGSVCQAVLHAHQKGIIHRDIKPSNVLVTLHDGVPVVKVIDFGVAKALGQQLTDKTLFTGFAQLVGTPLYMSPEQAELSGLDIDTRSDIYSLGVLLYELLTGVTPFDKTRLREAGYDEMRRIIREEEPPKPSTRLSTLGQAAMTVSERRQSDPKRLSRLFRGELDWIVMKALEKDRNRRYETASALAGDVERYLNDEPVAACPPSVRYRLRKFVRRNRRALAGTALVAVLLVVAVGTVTGSLIWRARDRAAMQEETERGLLEALAQAEAYLRETDDQMDDPVRWQMTVGLADGGVQRAERLLATGEARAELAERVRAVRAALDAQQRDSSLLVALERFQLEMGDWIVEAKEGHDESRAAPRYAALLGDYGVDPTTVTTAAARVRGSRLRETLLAALEHWLAVTRDAAERQQLAAVLQAAEPAATAFQQRWLAAVQRRDAPALAQLAGEPSVQQLPVLAILILARDLRAARQLVAAERLLRAWQSRYPGNFWLNHDLGRLLLNEKPARPAEAIRYLTAALALRSESPGVYQNLGNALRDTKDVEGAIRAFQAALKIDPNYASAHVSLGAALYDKKDVVGATREYQIALKIDPNDAMAHNNLGIVALSEKNDVDEAIRAFQTALKIQPSFALAHYNLAGALYKKRDLPGTLREFQAASNCDPSLVIVQVALGRHLRLHTKDLEGAIHAFQAALKIDPNCVQAHLSLGNILLWTKNRDMEGAIREYKEVIRIDPNEADAHYNLARAFRMQGRFAEALAAMQIAEILAKRLGEAGKNLRSEFPYWPQHPAVLVREFKELAELDARLTSVLKKESQPANAGERLQLASFCLEHKERFATAADWYAEAFAAEPTAADDMKAGHRYNAACAAALAGTGQGRDAGKLKEDERTRLRKQALTWLRADLARIETRLREANPQERTMLQEQLKHWQRDGDLIAVRDTTALQKLSAMEQEEWGKLWASVAELLMKAATPAE